MLKKAARLNLKTSFKWVRDGQRLESDLIKVFYRYSPVPHPPRVGIALSSSSFKTAVKRNRARRLISRCLELYYRELPDNLNLVILPKPAVLNYTSTDLSVEVTKLLEKINHI